MATHDLVRREVIRLPPEIWGERRQHAARINSNGNPVRPMREAALRVRGHLIIEASDPHAIAQYARHDRMQLVASRITKAALIVAALIVVIAITLGNLHYL